MQKKNASQTLSRKGNRMPNRRGRGCRSERPDQDPPQVEEGGYLIGRSHCVGGWAGSGTSRQFAGCACCLGLQAVKARNEGPAHGPFFFLGDAPPLTRRFWFPEPVLKSFPVEERVFSGFGRCASEHPDQLKSVSLCRNLAVDAGGLGRRFGKKARSQGNRTLKMCAKLGWFCQDALLGRTFRKVCVHLSRATGLLLVINSGC